MKPEQVNPVGAKSLGNISRAGIEALFARRQEAIDNLDAAALSLDYAVNEIDALAPDKLTCP